MMLNCVLSAAISEDRRHSSIAAAGRVDDVVLVQLLSYLDGTSRTVEAITAHLEEHEAAAVVVDPRSPGATLIKPLQDAGVIVTLPTTSDVVIAHGLFLDELTAGRLRKVSHAALDSAARHGTARPLSGAQAWQQHGQVVDVAPLSAATLAVWGVLSRPVLEPFAFYDDGPAAVGPQWVDNVLYPGAGDG